MFKKSTQKYHYLTAADKKRLADIENNTAAEDRKYKCVLTLSHPDIEAKVSITILGKSNEVLAQKVSEHVKFFKDHDSRWSLDSAVNLNASDVSDASDQVKPDPL